MSSHEALMEPPDTDSFKDEVFTPIGDEYEEYDPGEEMRRLHELGPRERREKSEELSRKYANRALAVANIYKDVLSRLYESPESTWQEVRKIVNDLCEKYETSLDIENYVYAAFERFQMKRRTIDELLARYSNPNDLFEKIFSCRPRGRIEIIRGPASIYFQLFNSQDYFFALNGKWPEEAGSEESTFGDTTYKTKGACLTDYSKIPELRGSILIENCEISADEVVKGHELQHSHFDILRDTLFRFFIPEFSANEIYSLKNGVLGSRSTEEFLMEAKRYFKAERRWAEISVQDEILAYMKSKKASRQNFNPVITDDNLWGAYKSKHDLDSFKFSSFELNIYATLVKLKDEDGLYDYTHDLRHALAEDMGDFFPSKTKCKEDIDEIFIDDYRSMIARGIKAYKDLFDMGLHHEEIIGILSFHSLKNWPGIVRRIVKMRSGKGKSGTAKF